MDNGRIILAYSQIFETHLREANHSTGAGLGDLVHNANLSDFTKNQFLNTVVPARNAFVHRGTMPRKNAIKACQRIAVELEIIEQIPRFTLSPPHRNEYKEILKSFHEDFARHSSFITSFVNYWAFHEAKESWLQGEGTLLSASHMEIIRLWSQIDLVDVYEAFLVRFLKNNGTITRIFAVSGNELANEQSRRLLASVFTRHKRLGFDTRVSSVVDLNRVAHKHGVNCDMFAVINNIVALFFRFPRDEYPLMVRTTEDRFVEKATYAFLELKRHSADADNWCRTHKITLSKEEEKQIDDDCNRIQALACDWGDS
jgi:hypothetical protein